MVLSARQLVLLLYFRPPCGLFFFFNDTATTEFYTLSLHDALPIFISGNLFPYSGKVSRIVTDEIVNPVALVPSQQPKLMIYRGFPADCHPPEQNPDARRLYHQPQPQHC